MRGAVWIFGVIVALSIALSYSTWWRLVLGTPVLRSVQGMPFGDALAVLRGASAFRAVELVVVREPRAGSACGSVTLARGSTVVLFVDDRGIVARAEFVARGSVVRHDGIVVSS